MGTRVATYLIHSSTVLLIGGLLSFFGLPLASQVNQLQKETQTITSQISEFDSRREEITRLALDKDLNHIYAQQLQQILPEIQDADGLTLLLDTYARRLGMELPALSLNAKPQTGTGSKALPPAVQALDFSLETIGEFDQLVLFLNRLEKGDRLIEIRTASMSGQDDGRILAHIEGRTFSKKPTLDALSATAVIDPATRNRIINRATETLPDLSKILLGHPNPFAPIE